MSPPALSLLEKRKSSKENYRRRVGMDGRLASTCLMRCVTIRLYIPQLDIYYIHQLALKNYECVVCLHLSVIF